MTEYIAWLDLETDGAEDYRDGHILEIGIAITNNDLEVVKTIHRVLHASERTLNRMPKRVREMHKASGLWDECLTSDDDVWSADFFIGESLAEFGGPLALAGSGVLHYDKKWVNCWLTRTSRYLTHWGYDVGVMRRVLGNLAGVPLPPKTKGLVGVEHRALDDAVSAVKEMEIYLEQLRDLQGWGV